MKCEAFKTKKSRDRVVLIMWLQPVHFTVPVASWPVHAGSRIMLETESINLAAAANGRPCPLIRGSSSRWVGCVQVVGVKGVTGQPQLT